MNKITRLILAGAASVSMSDRAAAQEAPTPPANVATARLAALVDDAPSPGPLPEALPRDPDEGVGGGVLQALPKPRDLPASLLAPPPPPSNRPISVDAPYFFNDPFLDRPALGTPGWFGGVEIQVLKPHLLSGLNAAVQNKAQKANGTSTLLGLPSANLDWTVSPRVFLGYRLPSGFGEFLVSYRNLETSGSGNDPAAAGATGLRSRLAFNIIDVDYNSRELSLWPRWDMRWTLGVRTMAMFFDTQFSQPYGQAAAGNGVFQARNYNNVAGAGPHAALEVARHLGDTGWSFYTRFDAASVFDGSHVGFLTRSTTLDPEGRPLPGETRHFGAQASPILNFRTGLTWQDSPSGALRLFIGYQYERFWALDRLPPTGTNPPSVGQVWDQGLVLQATFRY
jgi:hypothetical protein